MSTLHKSAAVAYVEKKKELAQLEEQVKAAKKECEHLESIVVEEMTLNGVTKQTVRFGDSAMTLYLKEELHCNVLAANRGALVEAVRSIGREDLITVDVPTARLKLAIKEWGDDGTETLAKDNIPAEVLNLVSIYTPVKLATRAS